MVDVDAVRRGYDELGSDYAAERPTTGPDVDAIRRFLDAVSAPSRLLDAGCGPGRPALPLLAEQATTVGLDVSRTQLQEAASAAPTARRVQGDLRRLPLADSDFDGALAAWSLIHVPRADHPRVIAELARVLRPHGRLLLVEGRKPWSGTTPNWLDRAVEMQWDIAGAETTRRHLREAGFHIDDEWGLPEELAEEDTESEDESLPWICFLATLTG